MFLVMLVGFVSAGAQGNPNPGSIWTTNGDCGNVSQDVNKYSVGDIVYINGANFNVGTYDWDITGLPGSLDPNTIVANGSSATDSNGAFCFKAYTIQSDDGGEYKANFNGKGDNYHVFPQTPIVPEFGATVGVLTVLGALGVFFFVRKK